MTSDRISIADAIEAHRDGEMHRQHLDGPKPAGWAEGMTEAAEFVRTVEAAQMRARGVSGAQEDVR